MRNKFLIIEERPYILLAILLGISLFIKAVLIYQTDIINPDGIRYINSAHEFFQGNIAAAFDHEKMLGFTFLLGLTHLVVPDWFLAGKILSCVALVMTTIPLYLIAQELFGKRAAFCTALVFTVIPSINAKCTDIVKDPSFLFLLVLSLWLILYALKESQWWSSLLAGLFCCLSVLVRPEGAVLFLVIMLFLVTLIAFIPESRRLNLKCLITFCVLPFVSLLLVIIPFVTGMISLEVLPGIYEKFALYFQTDILQVYRDIYHHLKDVEESFPGGEWTNDFFEYARYNIFLIYLVGMMQTFCKALFPVFLIPLIYGLKLRNNWNRHMALLLAVLASFLVMDYVLLVSRNFMSARYLLVPVVLSAVFIGYGMDRIITAINSFRYRRTAFSVAIILCLLLPLGRMFVKGSHEKLVIREAGVWLAGNRDLVANRMIVSEERIAYYAGLFRGDYDTFHEKRIDSLEKKALREDRGLIVIYKNQDDIDKIPDFKDFALIKKIDGRKKTVMIYERP